MARDQGANSISRRSFCSASIGVVIAPSVAIVAALATGRATGQQTQRLPRVALVFGSVPAKEMTGADPVHPYAGAFVRGLRDLGLVDGRDIVLVRLSSEGYPDRLPGLMEDVVRQSVDVIVTTGPGVRAAARATDRIAIVGVVGNALDTGAIESFARPGGNVTGIGQDNPEVYGKQLQLLKEAAPAISRVAVIAYSPPDGTRTRWRVEMDAAARALRLELVWLSADKPEDLDVVFATIVHQRADALFADGNHVNYAQRQRIADFALKQRLPSFGFTEEGMLLSYWDDLADNMRRAAGYVKKILNGAKPGDLPFEQSEKYLLSINLKTAKALGLTIPKELLLRADEVIQ
jgi:putative ABC transport system substrate-binding protein